MKKGDCGCRNHRGRRKVKYPDQDQALRFAVTYYAKHNGIAQVYPCPRMDGVWHIATPRRKEQ